MTPLATHLNRFALVLALVLFAGLGGWWAWDRTRTWEPPRWPDERFAALVPAAAVADTAGERWIVAVNPACGSCLRRLAALERAGAAARGGAPLGALLVDTRARPDSVALGDSLAAGVWWDSTGAWRSRWGHRVYGETLVFGPGGALVRVLAPGGESAEAAR